MTPKKSPLLVLAVDFWRKRAHVAVMKTTLAAFLVAATAAAQDCYRKYDTASESLQRQQIAFELQRLNNQLRIQEMNSQNARREEHIRETFRWIYEK